MCLPAKTLGITGGMGSGKSVVSRLLEINGLPVYNTDKAGAWLSNCSDTIREKLTARWGNDLYKFGILDRKLLGTFLFNNADDLAFVNSIIHPEVKADFEAWRAEQRCPWVGIESAILFESGFDRFCDFVVNVSAPRDEQIRRVKQRDKLSEEAVLARLDRQLADEERSRLAGYTLYNSDGQAIIPQVEKLLKALTLKNTNEFVFCSFNRTFVP